MYRNLLNPNCKTPSIGQLKAIKKLMSERNLNGLEICTKTTNNPEIEICNKTNLLEFSSSRKKKDKNCKEVFFTVNTNDVQENTLKCWNYEITEKIRWFEHALNVMFVQIETKYNTIMKNITNGNIEDEVKKFQEFVKKQKELVEKSKAVEIANLVEVISKLKDKDVDINMMAEVLQEEKFINMMKCYFAGKDK